MIPVFRVKLPHEPKVWGRKPGGFGKCFPQIAGQPFNDRLPPPMFLLPLHDPLTDAPIEVDQFPVDGPIRPEAATADPFLDGGEELCVVGRKRAALFFFGRGHFSAYYPLSYPLLRVLSLFRQIAPGPRPKHSTRLDSWRLPRTRRIISRLTPASPRSARYQAEPSQAWRQIGEGCSSSFNSASGPTIQHRFT